MSKRKYYYTKKYRDLKKQLSHIPTSSSLSSVTDNNEAFVCDDTYMYDYDNEEKRLLENVEVPGKEMRSSYDVDCNMDNRRMHKKLCTESLLSLSSSASEEFRQDEDVEEQNITLSEKLDSDITFKQKIREWAMRHISSLNNKMLSNLLCVLKTEHDEFPCTATMFLQTNKSKNVIRPMLSANESYGSYIYFGLEKILTSIINPEVYKEDSIKFLVNIDGVQIYNHSKQQFWPILIMLHKKYITPQVIAIYHGESKPKSMEFLDDFLTELIRLMATNIIIRGKTYNVKVLGFVCDTPARAFIKCIKSHVAYYACERCVVKGKTVGKKRIYARTTCELRTKQSFQMRSQPEHHLDGNISPLLRIPDFDPVRSVFLDSMHLLFLGVAKTLLNCILFGGSKAGGIGPRNRLLLYNLLRGFSNQIPAEFQRKVFDIFDIKNWKATQFRFFFLYCSVLILHRVLPTPKYKHFCLFYVACRLLCSDNLAVSNAGIVKKMLLLFFRFLPKFYGPQIQSISFHNLIHLADDVSNMRCSLTSFSAFPFENFLMTLKKLVRAPNHPLHQVANCLTEITLNTNQNIQQIASLKNIKVIELYVLL